MPKKSIMARRLPGTTSRWRKKITHSPELACCPVALASANGWFTFLNIVFRTISCIYGIICLQHIKSPLRGLFYNSLKIEI
jgi:hypothetical protein